MVNISFLCNEPWVESHADPIIRSIPYLAAHNYHIKVFITPWEESQKPWPDTSIESEKVRREQLEFVIAAAISRKPDFILCYQRNITPSLLRSKIPLVIFEHTDGTALELSRYLIHLDNVIGVIKGTVFSDKKFYNGPFCEGMYHGQFINHLSLPCVSPKHQIEDLSKIELGYTFGAFPSNRRLLDQDINTQRDIPISFVGSVNYPRSRLITHHRTTALNMAQKMGVGKTNIPVEEFDRILLASKICLSPLGYGACYRSFEGLYAGCVVVQPDCSYMISWPNIYIPNKYYVPCDFNFSDLDAVVNSVLNNWSEWDDHRYENKALLEESYWNEETLGNQLKGIFDRCCQRIK